MALIGSPDFLTAQQQSNDVLFNGNVTTVGAVPTNLGTFPVSQWLGVAFALSTLGVDVAVVVSYFMDDAATVLIATRNFGISTFNTTPNFWTAPVLGPYMTVTVATAVGHAPACSVIMAGTNRIGPTFPVANTAGLVEAFNQPLGAGVNATFDFAFLYSGPVSVSVITSFATPAWQLFWVDIAGGGHRLCRMAPAAALDGTPQGPIYVPPSHLQVRVDNASAGAGTFSVFVTADAFRSDS